MEEKVGRKLDVSSLLGKIFLRRSLYIPAWYERAKWDPLVGSRLRVILLQGDPKEESHVPSGPGNVST